MITVYSDDHHHQDAQSELTGGQLVPPYDNPRRADVVLAHIQQTNLGAIVPPEQFGLEPILRVHDPKFVDFLQTAWQDWVAEQGEQDALPLNWATRTMRHDRIPETIEGKLSYYSFDAGTPIIAGTWQAATAAANVALTGQKLLQEQRKVFALCRPPGHHAARDFYGGYCFLNNAAIAAQALRDQGAERVAVFDVDYHHGNGTQAIFYDRSDVLFVSIHAHPSQSFPYFLGFDDETGTGAGEGYNRNYPLQVGTDWAAYSPTLANAIQQIHNYSPDALVVSLGVDTFEHDPISEFRLTSEDYCRMGEAIAQLQQPTLVVMEGGYAIEQIGMNVVNFLQGLAS
ncbi:MAG: acetylpolyamine amidohydrolase AphB [Elainellaceae cyanobacterium]